MGSLLSKLPSFLDFESNPELFTSTSLIDWDGKLDGDENCVQLVQHELHIKRMEKEVIGWDIVLPTHLGFKRIQMYDKYPKGQAIGRHWKHLKQIIQAENYSHQPGCDF